MPPRTKLPGVPAARAPSTAADPAHASSDHVAQEATPAPAGARPYEFYMNQLSGLRVDSPAAKGPTDGTTQPEKPQAKLPRDTFFTVDLPPPPAGPAGVMPEKLHIDTSVSIEPAGKTQGRSPGDAAKAESPLPASTGGGAKPGDPFDWARNLFSAGGDALPPGTGARLERPAAELPLNMVFAAELPQSLPAAAGGGQPGKPPADMPGNTFFTIDPPPPPLAAPGGVKPEKLRIDTPIASEPAGKTQGSSPGHAATTGKPKAESPLPAATCGGPGKPEKPPVEASVTIEPASTTPHSAPESDADRMQKSQAEYFRQMQQLQEQTNQQQLMTAILKQEGDMASAMASFIKQSGRGIKDLAAG